MSYVNPCANGCTRHPYMSNPNVTFMGLPTGIADQRDNHRTGNLIAPIAANWKTNPIFADSFEGGEYVGVDADGAVGGLTVHSYRR